MNKAILITARTNSSRLPGKAIIDINGVPTISHLIKNNSCFIAGGLNADNVGNLIRRICYLHKY